jgi:hypothetical protein
MRAISDAIPSTVPAITEPWLGTAQFSTQLAAFGAWALAATLAIGWLTRRRFG